ncbi:MAG: DUF3276 family protein [Candidatus Moraniibacteriota bacterium]
MSTYPMPAQGAVKIQEKVFSKMLRAGSKTYFFDIKKASNGSNYLTIAESSKNQKGEQVTNRLMVFKDQFPAFSASLGEASQFLK